MRLAIALLIAAACFGQGVQNVVQTGTGSIVNISSCTFVSRWGVGSASAAITSGGTWNGSSCVGGNTFQGSTGYFNTDSSATIASECNTFTGGSKTQPAEWHGTNYNQATWQALGYDLHSTFN